MPPSTNQPTPFQPGRSLRIAVVAFDGISPFHLAVPCMVFGEDRRELGVPHYELKVCALESGALQTSAGFSIDAGYGLTGLRGADVVIVPSWRDTNEPAPPRLLKALQTAHSSGATIVGLCLGAFVLAEAGLLHGREATTHWHWAKHFAKRFPEVRLNAKVLYVDAGQVLTSAGTAAGLDCCMHLLRRWCGAEVANRVARRLVVAPHRAGGQAQFIEHSLPATTQADRMAATIDYAATHLDQPLTLDDLAKRAAMSRRSFTRHFLQRTGSSVVDAEVILTHRTEVKLTHLGEDGGHFGAADVDPGASSGDPSHGPQGRERQGDREAVGLLAQHGAPVSARRGGEALPPS